MQKIEAKFKNTNILVADDFPVNLELVQEMLELMECKVDTAKDGSEALKLSIDNDYDLIFMDVQMPDIDGYEVTRQIRAHEEEQHTPIVAITANALSGDKDKCLAAGMDDYISKPIKGANLEEMLKKYLPSKSE